MSSALSSVIFVWTSVLSFSSLVSLQGVFHLFIYLFILVVLQVCVGTQLYQGCVCQKKPTPKFVSFPTKYKTIMSRNSVGTWNQCWLVPFFHKKGGQGISEFIFLSHLGYQISRF